MPLVTKTREASPHRHLDLLPRCMLESYMELEISSRDLQKKLKDRPHNPEPFCLLDVREPWEAQLCLLPGSRLIPMGDLPSCAHRDLNPEAHIVVYCHHGVRSLNAVLWLREQGFEQAQSLAGGIEAWASAVDPSVTRY